MKARYYFLLPVFLLISGCVTAPPMELGIGGAKVKVAKSDPGDNYEIIGPVSGYDGEGCGAFGYRGTYERAMTSLRNKASRNGGSYAQLISLTEPHLRGDCFDNQYVIRATSYRKVRNKPSPLPIIEMGEEGFTKKLRELKSLYDDGVLSKKEYGTQKARLLKRGF